MITESVIKKINELFREFQQHGKDYRDHIGQGISEIEDYWKIFNHKIPDVLRDSIPEDKYQILASIGKGRITGCPWLAIINQEGGDTIRQGVYLVFLLSQDLKKIYLSLAQGVTNTPMDEVVLTRNKIREALDKLKSPLLSHEDMDISNGKYKESAVYSNEWKCDDPIYSFNLLKEYIKVYDIYKGGQTMIEFPQNNIISSENLNTNEAFSIKKIISEIKSTGLIYSDNLIKRLVFSLMSKRFLILSGLAGSGKTQLALTFAKCLVSNAKEQICVVPVGADWTNREPLLGYPNALQPDDYVKPESGVLDLLIESTKVENKNKPYFLILDEMNMSYVERYFADFLSSMESKESIRLWKRNTNHPSSNDVPESIKLPHNLFIIGTINVDETTYMFSPKVLDRANVIEFKISLDEMSLYLENVEPVDTSSIIGKAESMSKSFIELCARDEIKSDSNVVQVLCHFFNELKSVNAEFGYRSATEIYRFISQAEKNDDSDDKLTNDQIIDCAIVQKLLPKLHGSRKKLEPVLLALWKECFGEDIQKETSSISIENVSKAKYPLTADKLRRMYEAAYANGFTSFAEA